MGGQLKNKPAISTEAQKFAVGETVLILRSHLWAGAVGEVVGFSEGLHRVRIKNRHDDKLTPFFHTDVRASQLEGFI